MIRNKIFQSTLKKLFWISAGSSLLILLTIQTISDRLSNSIKNIFNLQTTNLQIKDSDILLKQVQSLQELTTSSYQMETIVPTHADLTLGKDWKIATTKLLYLAKGEVKAGIDLSQLNAQDIQVNQQQIIITLPPAQILDSKIDLNHSQVYHYDRGFLNLGPDVAPQLQTLAQQKTLDKIVSNACEQGILNSANQKAQEVIDHILTITHEPQVEIQIKTSAPQNCG